MGFWDWLLNRRGPTFDWVAKPDYGPRVDLARPSLCGVGLAQRIGDRLFDLGPGQEPRKTKGFVKFARFGIIVSFILPDGFEGLDYIRQRYHDLILESFEVVVSDGPVRFERQGQPLPAGLNMEVLREALGEPDEEHPFESDLMPAVDGEWLYENGREVRTLWFAGDELRLFNAEYLFYL